MKKTALTLMLTAALAGCATTSPVLQPKVEAPAVWAEKITPTGAAVSPEWWNSFNSAELQSLVDQALAGSPDLAIAIERVRASNAESTDENPGGVLVLTDMFGGTPGNLAVTFVSPHVEVITGVNLPMLIKLARPQPQHDLLTLAREMREDGRNAIWVASDLLRGEKA